MRINSTISPGSKYTLYQEIYEVTSVDTHQITLRSLQNKHPVFLTHDIFQTLQAKGVLLLYQLAPIDKSLASIITNLTTLQSKSALRKIHYVRGLKKNFKEHCLTPKQ